MTYDRSEAARRGHLNKKIRRENEMSIKENQLETSDNFNLKATIENALANRRDPFSFIEDSRELRDPVSYLGVVSMNLPPEYIAANPQYDFCMINYRSMNQDFPEKIDEALRLHYVPIKCDEHPSLGKNMTLNLFGNADSDNYYRKNGHIGMKRLKNQTSGIEAYFNTIARDEENAIKTFSHEKSNAELYTSVDDRRHY